MCDSATSCNVFQNKTSFVHNKSPTHPQFGEKNVGIEIYRHTFNFSKKKNHIFVVEQSINLSYFGELNKKMPINLSFSKLKLL